MATLYTQTTQDTSSNWNWNAANDRYAWQFVPTASGTPTSIKLYTAGVTGTPTGEIYIKANKTLASTTHGSATGLTFTSGENTIVLASGVQIDSGTTYWVYFIRTSSAANYPSFQYDSTKTNYEVWRPSASDSDPDTLWFTNDIKMTIEGTAAAAATSKNLALLGIG